MTGATRVMVSMVLLATATAPALGDEPKGLKVDVKNDVVYTKAGDTELKIDLAYPAEGDGPFPAVLVIHGGAWRSGNKSDNRPALAEMARRGYVAASPQYRFCPKDVFPAQLHDVKSAVRWLKAHAKDYKADPDRFGAVGFSAGGHLSMMLGFTGPADGLEGDAPEGSPDTKLKAVVNYFGPTDMAAADLPEATRPLVADFLGGSAADKPKAASQASPLTFVSKGDPPVLTFQGTRDPLVPMTQAVKLAEKMSAEGVPGRVEVLVGAGHGWQGPELTHTLEQTVAFFDQYLKPAAATATGR